MAKRSAAIEPAKETSGVTVTEIAAIFAERVPEEAELHRFCASQNFDIRAALDAIALDIGRRFLAGMLSFDEADGMINRVWGYSVQRDEISATMYAVYEAFDRGEYRGPNDTRQIDPVESLTRPLLKQLIEDEGAA